MRLRHLIPVQYSIFGDIHVTAICSGKEKEQEQRDTGESNATVHILPRLFARERGASFCVSRAERCARTTTEKGLFLAEAHPAINCRAISVVPLGLVP